MFMIGEVSEEARRLVGTAQECLNKGIEAVKPWVFRGYRSSYSRICRK